MYKKPIKQMGAIETSVVNPSNTPVVPNQFQTGAYVDPTSVVQNPPVPPAPVTDPSLQQAANMQHLPLSQENQMKRGKTMSSQQSFRLAQNISTAGDTLSYKIVPDYKDSDNVTVNKKIPISNKDYKKLKNQ